MNPVCVLDSIHIDSSYSCVSSALHPSSTASISQSLIDLAFVINFRFCRLSTEASEMYTLVAFGLATLGVRTVLAQDDTPNPCVAYGMDFQNGGSYFQNSNSNDNFTFVSEFDGKKIKLWQIILDP